MRADTIVGYTYRADNYDPACVLYELPAARPFLGAHGRHMTVEDVLDQCAAAMGIDRADERSFDSGDFPKVIFADMVEGDQCGRCHNPLID